MTSLLTQSPELSGFVVPMSLAPGTLSRPSNCLKNASGSSVISSAMAKQTEAPRRRPSARASAAPTRCTVRPRITAVVDPRVCCTCRANTPNRAGSWSGSIRFRSIVCNDRPAMMTRPVDGATDNAIRNATSDAIVFPDRIAPDQRAIRCRAAWAVDVPTDNASRTATSAAIAFPDRIAPDKMPIRCRADWAMDFSCLRDSGRDPRSTSTSPQQQEPRAAMSGLRLVAGLAGPRQVPPVVRAALGHREEVVDMLGRGAAVRAQVVGNGAPVLGGQGAIKGIHVRLDNLATPVRLGVVLLTIGEVVLPHPGVAGFPILLVVVGDPVAPAHPLRGRCGHAPVLAADQTALRGPLPQNGRDVAVPLPPRVVSSAHALTSFDLFAPLDAARCRYTLNLDRVRCTACPVEPLEVLAAQPLADGGLGSAVLDDAVLGLAGRLPCGIAVLLPALIVHRAETAPQGPPTAAPGHCALGVLPDVLDRNVGLHVAVNTEPVVVRGAQPSAQLAALRAALDSAGGHTTGTIRHVGTPRKCRPCPGAVDAAAGVQYAV